VSLFSFFFQKKKETAIFYKKIADIIDYSPKNKILFKKAFTHKSMNIKNLEGESFNFERLEYLGDSLLNAVIASHLFHELPTSDEGKLTEMKSKIVCRENLNKIGEKLELLSLLNCSINKQKFGEDIHGNILEALIGAVYIDKGYDYCKKLVKKIIINPYVKLYELSKKIISFKKILLEWSQKNNYNISFEIISEKDEKDSNKFFCCNLFLNGKKLVSVNDTSKKKSEERASKLAFTILNVKY
tara:strand:+ start:108 stop:836 length:729 start_codon:yes stop_codon:yes gene_type:complete